MLGEVFDYVERKDEMMCSLNHFHIYHKKVKSSLKSDYTAEAIEKIVIYVKNKLWYVAHHKFMIVSMFGFLGDSIVEATNSGMKWDSIRVSTNMTIHISGSTQIKISENQSQKKNKQVNCDDVAL